MNLLLSRIALEPDVVRLIFDTKPGGKETDNPNANGNGNENWLKAIEKLDRAIAATNGIDRVKGALDKESGNSTSNIKLNKKDKSKEDDSVDAIKEARNVAEACRIVVSQEASFFHLLNYLQINRIQYLEFNITRASILTLSPFPLPGLLQTPTPPSISPLPSQNFSNFESFDSSISNSTKTESSILFLPSKTFPSSCH